LGGEPDGRVGLIITGVLKLGPWARARRFVSVRRWVPALRLVVDDATAEQLGYHELLITTPDVDHVVALAPLAPIMRRRRAGQGARTPTSALAQQLKSMCQHRGLCATG
jgi:hypothetical protein